MDTDDILMDDTNDYELVEISIDSLKILKFGRLNPTIEQWLTEHNIYHCIINNGFKKKLYVDGKRNAVLFKLRWC